MAQQNRPSPPPLPPLSPSSSARRTGTRPARAATRPGHLLLPRPLQHDATERHAAPGSLSLSPSPHPLLCSLSLSARAELVATDAVRRGHSHRLASPTPPKAPPRPTLRPHCSKQHQEPCSDAIAAVFTDGHRRSPARFSVSRSPPSPLRRALQPQ